jgi:uncharacterized membrane protein
MGYFIQFVCPSLTIGELTLSREQVKYILVLLVAAVYCRLRVSNTIELLLVHNSSIVFIQIPNKDLSRTKKNINSDGMGSDMCMHHHSTAPLGHDSSD